MPYRDLEKRREYAKMHYENNKDRYIEKNRLRRQLLKAYIGHIKTATPCADCRINYPYYVMDFDHIHNKEGLIRKFINSNNKRLLLEELSKCEVVCSNCHRIRTYNRMGQVS